MVSCHSLIRLFLLTVYPISPTAGVRTSPAPASNQPSLKSHDEDLDGDARSHSDSSWRQLQQISSVDKDELLQLQMCSSNITITNIPPIASKSGELTATTPAKGKRDDDDAKVRDTAATTLAAVADAPTPKQHHHQSSPKPWLNRTTTNSLVSLLLFLLGIGRIQPSTIRRAVASGLVVTILIDQD